MGSNCGCKELLYTTRMTVQNLHGSCHVHLNNGCMHAREDGLQAASVTPTGQVLLLQQLAELAPHCQLQACEPTSLLWPFARPPLWYGAARRRLAACTGAQCPGRIQAHAGA